MLKPILLAACLVCAPAAIAQGPIIAIGIEADARLVGSDAVPPERATPDQMVFFDIAAGAPRRIGAVEVPVSFQGPPTGIAISPDRTLAFVPAANGRGTGSAAKTLVPIDILSVIDLGGGAPRLVQTLHLGMAATSAALSPDGLLLIVTHADDHAATLLRVSGKRAEIAGRFRFEAGSRPLAAVFLPDGRSLAVTLAGKNRVALFRWRGTEIEPTPFREISAGLYPASFALCGNRGLAVVGNYGTVSGDQDTVSLIDLRAEPERVIDTVSVGPSPEGLDCAADGRHVVTANQNMSTIDHADPLYAPYGEVVLLAIQDRKLVVKDRARIGPWAQGAVFLSADIIAAESIEDRRLHLFRLVDDRLVRLEPIAFENGGPATLGRSAE
jgi:DNA-binding beta-propeller fold protein YncE